MRRSKDNARSLALSVLREWNQTTAFADALLHDRLAETSLASVDRAFTTELVYGVIRNLRLLDFWIAHFRSGAIDPETRDVLRLGVYQLLLLETAEHAAIYETVELASRRARATVNAVLRNVQRRRSELLEQARAAPLPIRTSHPDFLVERWTARYGAENTQAFCEWNNRTPPTYARANLLKTTVAAVRARYPQAQPLDVAGTMLRFDQLPRDALDAGECYVQDPSTLLACDLLAPQPNDCVLDACAAPGGKTSYLAELMQNRGRVIAADRDRQRAELLRANLDRLGVAIAKVVQCDWTRNERPNAVLESAPFDRILVDAPCSNTGVIRRRVDARWRLTPADFSRMRKQQLAIVRAVVPLLKGGGVLVYSTCSIEHEENEEMVEQLAANFPELKLQTAAARLPFREAMDGAFAAKFTRRC